MKKNSILTIRLIKRHIARFLTILAIVFVSVGFMSGVGESENVFRKKINEVYFSQNVPDLYIKSTLRTGFSEEQLSKIEVLYGEDNIMKGYCEEFSQNKKVTRIYSFNLYANNVNKLEILEGDLPQNDSEVLVERKTKIYRGASVGEEVSINGKSYTVSGIVQNALLMHKAQESGFTKSGRVDQVFYINTEDLSIVNDVYVTLGEREAFNFFNVEYEEKVNKAKNEVSLELESSNVKALSLYDNIGLYSVKKYARMIGKLGSIFVIFFLLLTMLIVYSTMTRLFKEERKQIICQKTLGYSNFSIIKRFIIFVFSSTLIGGLVAFGVGQFLCRLIYQAIGAQYSLPSIGPIAGVSYYALTFVVILTLTTLLIFIYGLRSVSRELSVIPIQKEIKANRKILIERITFLWKRLNVKHKATIRNVCLYKSRFVMTLISIIGSSVLVVGGLGLYDIVRNQSNMQAIILVSIFIIIFSASLTLLVMCNITNMNVSERCREMSILMISGYMNHKIMAYMFREINVITILGILIGVPCGYWFLGYVYNVLGFGSVGQIGYWVWLASPILVMFFSFLSTIIMRPKILRIDMNESLRRID